MSKRLDLIGQRFGRLTVKEFSHVNKWKNTHWKCVCDCGNEVIIYGMSLKSGHTKSCGCYRVEQLTGRQTTHGQSVKGKPTKAYVAWIDMHARCDNPEHRSYDNYGGRGILVCDRWFEFENFYIDMGSPLPHQSIDRINVNEGYSPENCRWTDWETQANNKRNTRFIEYKGLKMSITQWERFLGFKRYVLQSRIYAGWSVEKAFTTPKQKRRKQNGIKNAA